MRVMGFSDDYLREPVARAVRGSPSFAGAVTRGTFGSRPESDGTPKTLVENLNDLALPDDSAALLNGELEARVQASVLRLWDGQPEKRRCALAWPKPFNLRVLMQGIIRSAFNPEVMIRSIPTGDRALSSTCFSRQKSHPRFEIRRPAWPLVLAHRRALPCRLTAREVLKIVRRQLKGFLGMSATVIGGTPFTDNARDQLRDGWARRVQP